MESPQMHEMGLQVLQLLTVTQLASKVPVPRVETGPVPVPNQTTIHFRGAQMH